MNIISNTASVRLFLVIPMAEGVACVDGNGSFDNQTDEAAPTSQCSTSRSSRRASKAAVLTWTELKSDRKSVSTRKVSEAIVEALWEIPRYVPGISQSLSASTTRQLVTWCGD